MNTCSFCNWTNIGLLNIAEPSAEPRWICHGCVKLIADARDGMVPAPKRMYPIQDGPSVPWEVMAPHEAMSQKNHSQSIARIAERGGFSCAEAWMIVNAIEYKGGETKETWDDYRRKWIAYAERINTGMVPVAKLQPTIELLHLLRNRYSAVIHPTSVQDINTEITRLQSILGEKREGK